MITEHLTFDLETSFNPFDEIYADIKATHLAISPEVRYWFRRPQYGHYLGANILTSIYDLRFQDYTAKGRMVAIGVTYGYGFIISKRISITPNIGVGYGAFDESDGSGIKFHPTLTKLGANISYIIK